LHNLDHLHQLLALLRLIILAGQLRLIAVTKFAGNNAHIVGLLTYSYPPENGGKMAMLSPAESKVFTDTVTAFTARINFFSASTGNFSFSAAINADVSATKGMVKFALPVISVMLPKESICKLMLQISRFGE
jgi:hypothetical protein